MLENLTRSDFFIGRVDVGFVYVDEEAHRTLTENEVLHGNQQRCNKRSRSFISLVRL
ncbi:hypothetical protein [Priestia megaterium]|uniref:hypothetical protein n=1 Tax=Priestia megaterium TaxID=1404 RepID=UPI003CF97F65